MCEIKNKKSFVGLPVIYRNCGECQHFTHYDYRNIKQELEDIEQGDFVGGPIFIGIGCRAFKPLIFRSHDHKEGK